MIEINVLEGQLILIKIRTMKLLIKKFYDDAIKWGDISRAEGLMKAEGHILEYEKILQEKINAILSK